MSKTMKKKVYYFQQIIVKYINDQKISIDYENLTGLFF